MHIHWVALILIVLLLLIAVLRALNGTAYPESFNMPLGQALRLNLWGIVAITVSVAARVWLNLPGDPSFLRIAVALSPLLPGVLYARSILHWIRGLDELQRRIQYEACLYAAAGIGLVFMSFDLLLSARCIPPLHWGWEGAFALTFIFWMLGSLIANRRYS